jgi:hypothetical protein
MTIDNGIFQCWEVFCFHEEPLVLVFFKLKNILVLVLKITFGSYLVFINLVQNQELMELTII